MTTTIHRQDTTVDHEPILDETAVAAAAADFSRRLEAMTSRHTEARAEAQARFDAEGLPRGLAG